MSWEFKELLSGALCRLLDAYPHIEVKNPTARIEHEASTSKIGEDQLFYLQQRGIGYEKPWLP
ncbi:putative SUF system FeS cluster assembly, SufBD [Rosa chinensis]|uniref:Putative SUF system FeS cluster assembly, SufBD n=1 Tax=Rosa chinensis TaxID=74649 RepID=A0A2P6Q2R4_ROSCH|nr:putative SUF system FeS cluster assembly, SufBD [Rosa chinensis]